MKRTASFIITFILCIVSTVATYGGNGQRVVAVDDGLYDAMCALYFSQGMAAPSSTGPWTVAEMDMMLERIDVSRLSAGERRLYDMIADELGRRPRFQPDDALAIDAGIVFSPYMYVHSNSDDFTNPDDWSNDGWWGDWNRMESLLAIPLAISIGDHMYGYTEIQAGANRSMLADIHEIGQVSADANGQVTSVTTSPSSVSYSGRNILSNVFLLPPGEGNDFNLNFPYSAFASAGGEHWNLMIGRQKLSWGPGVTGNLMIGDQIPYHNNARFSAFTRSFKYTFSVSSFIHPMNYTFRVHETDPRDEQDKWFDYLDLYYDQARPRDGLSMFIAHRLEWRIGERADMAITEAIMYQSESGNIDLSVLSPTALFHNYYIRGNANSLLSFELDMTIFRNFNFYAVFLIDEINGPGEYDSDEPFPPSAFGAQVGIRTSWPMEHGYLYGSLEGVYTDPFLYLRDDGRDPRGSGAYGVNFIVAVPEYVNGTGGQRVANYSLEFLGYRYGNDSIVADLNLGWKDYRGWSMEGNFMYLVQGVMDRYSRWSMVDRDVMGPTSSSSLGSYIYDDHRVKDAVSHTLLFTISADVQITDWLTIKGKADCVTIFNYMNMKGRRASDFQFSIGIIMSY